jgi:hypothetical protein
MNQSHSKAHHQQIDWRRDQVMQLSSKGYGIREIARTLQISHPTIVRDVAYLRQQSKEKISRYIDEQLPEEYQKCLLGITAIMKESWDTAASAESNGDRRDKLAALSLAKDCYAMKLDLLSSATVVDRAVHFVDRHRGLTYQNKEVTIDNDRTAEPIKDT